MSINYSSLLFETLLSMEVLFLLEIDIKFINEYDNNN